MHTAYIALGTNLGDKKQNLQRALEQIAENIGALSAVSSVHASEPWGYISDNAFLNQVVRVQTPLPPLALLHALKAIEKRMGRPAKTASAYEDRIIDLDIILYDDLHYQSEILTIPHPRYLEREFVVVPLKEVWEGVSF